MAGECARDPAELLVGVTWSRKGRSGLFMYLSELGDIPLRNVGLGWWLDTYLLQKGRSLCDPLASALVDLSLALA